MQELMSELLDYSRVESRRFEAVDGYVVVGSAGKGEKYGRSFIYSSFCPRFATMTIDYSLNECQPDTSAFKFLIGM